MRIIADLHLHSKYSRACSRDLDLEHIHQWCQYKGINLVGTADFTHPAWFKEIKTKLSDDGSGLYQLKNYSDQIKFILSTEISCIYSQGGQMRRLHICLLVPSLATVEKIIANFEKRNFNLQADGRPIIGLSAKALAEIVLEIDSQSLIIPAHAWTPWFAVFGSKSGFDSLKECFEDLTPQIYSIETGLSSDPPMNWQLSALDNITLISNSDAHSPANLGREANVFEIEQNKFNYQEIYRIIKEKDQNKFLYTIEFFPEEGKYHIDGHANCNYSCLPAVSKRNNNLCPVCKKPLTLGVLHRVNDLADRQQADSGSQIPFRHLIPLQEIIAATLAVNKSSKKVANLYFNLVKKIPEFNLLLDSSETELKKIAGDEITDSIIKMRAGKINIEPGYDGIFGKISVNQKLSPQQKSLL